MSASAEPLTTRMAKLMVGGAVFAAAVYAVDLGIAKAAHWYLVPAFVIGLLCVVVGEILSWHNAAIAWHERRAGSMMLWAVLAFVCSAGTLYTNFSTSALNQEEKSSVQLSAFTASDDLRKSEEEAAFALKAAMDARSKLKPQRSAAEARAVIDSSEAHRWWGNTEKCTAAKGPQRQKFCDDYRSAQADLKMWDDISVEDARISKMQDKVQGVRSERKTVKAVVSDDTPGVTLIANVVGDKTLARQMDSMTLPFLVQAIMLFGGVLLANEHARNIAKRPWINWRKVGFYLNWTLCALSFRPLPDYHQHVVDPHGAQAKQALHSMANRMEQNRQAYGAAA